MQALAQAQQKVGTTQCSMQRCCTCCAVSVSTLLLLCMLTAYASLLLGEYHIIPPTLCVTPWNAPCNAVLV
jgi:hypothetical protein